MSGVARRKQILGWLFLSPLVALVLAGCVPAAASVLPQSQTPATTLAPETAAPVATVTATPAPSVSPTPQPTATVEPSPTPEPSATLAPARTPCPQEQCVYSDAFPLRLPIAPGGVDTVDRSYAFGRTQDGQREPHHGVEFLNGSGTPVLAAGDGVVVVAEDDRQYYTKTRYELTEYGPYPYFYGNVIIIQHEVPPGVDGPLYTLYAHLSEMLVQPGERVQAGQEIGRVGMTGAATGSHLHFEVRLGGKSYGDSRNPELWLQPHADASGVMGGALAGRVLDAQGRQREVESVVVEHLLSQDGPSDWEIYLRSYEEEAVKGLPPYGESFAVGDLPAGWYRVSFVAGGMQHYLVQVHPGSVTVLTYQVQE